MEEEGESEMERKRSQKRSQGELEESPGEMHLRLWSWRRERPPVPEALLPADTVPVLVGLT